MEVEMNKKNQFVYVLGIVSTMSSGAMDHGRRPLLPGERTHPSITIQLPSPVEITLPAAGQDSSAAMGAPLLHNPVSWPETLVEAKDTHLLRASQPELPKNREFSRKPWFVDTQ